MDREKIMYSIGLDIGTSSVGWAVIDNNFKLLKKGNKNMWGSRLFETAETAANRRENRSTRRRYNKRRERIRLLQELMANMVLSVDPTFFIRLSQTTFLDEEDKSALLNDKYQGNYNLFIENDLFGLLKNYFDGSPYKVLDYYFEGKIKPWHLKQGPKNYFKSKENRINCADLLKKKILD